MSKLNQEELSGQIDTWLVCCKHDGIKIYGSCKKCPCEEICEQAENQIKEMIQKPEITEQFITDKAKLFVYAIMPSDIEPTRPDIHAAKEFLRTLFEEVKWMKESGCS